MGKNLVKDPCNSAKKCRLCKNVSCSFPCLCCLIMPSYSLYPPRSIQYHCTIDLRARRLFPLHIFMCCMNVSGCTAWRTLTANLLTQHVTAAERTQRELFLCLPCGPRALSLFTNGPSHLCASSQGETYYHVDTAVHSALAAV